MTTVAAFDFDGTITYRDTLLPFLFSITGPTTGTQKMVSLLPALAASARRKASRAHYKELLLTKFLSDMPLQEAQQFGRLFALNILQKKLKPDAIQRIRWHQNQGHRCILVSANLDLYLHPWATHYGFHDVLTSQCEVDSYGHLTGKLLGSNCRGPEKVRRLQALLGPRSSYTLYAYGDSFGDREMLDLADYPFYRKLM